MVNSCIHLRSFCQIDFCNKTTPSSSRLTTCFSEPAPMMMHTENCSTQRECNLIQSCINDQSYKIGEQCDRLLGVGHLLSLLLLLLLCYQRASKVTMPKLMLVIDSTSYVSLHLKFMFAYISYFSLWILFLFQMLYSRSKMIIQFIFKSSKKNAKKNHNAFSL